MAAAVITYEDVAAAATAIRARQATPTQQAVRDELGGRGSFTTIANHLRVFNGRQALMAARPEMPVSVREHFETTWLAAVDQASTNLAALQRDHQVTVSTLTSERTAAEAEITVLEQKVAALETDLVAHVDQRTKDAAAVIALTTELAVAKAANAGLERQVADLVAQRTAAETERADLRTMNQTLLATIAAATPAKKAAT